ncbi:hypothetical protein Y1Q_0012885 [Alligator mississippiensis]|uniref:Uncharacterized protein n=1 Tax=Alligator mississippiensis TaxID=8496 RepID=A0A151P4E8_ALLMI|nr:hypothetical protein Y1Q_0012885 [Alligator mississippiensis]
MTPAACIASSSEGTSTLPAAQPFEINLQKPLPGLERKMRGEKMSTASSYEDPHAALQNRHECWKRD